MRTALLALTAAALITVSACGSDTSSTKPTAETSTSTSLHDGMSMDGMDMATDDPTTPTADPASADSSKSVVEDATQYAVALEQVFFQNGYPKNLAGAVTEAKKLDLSLTPGNEFGSYVYDFHDQEFQLCVEGPDGAWSTYDTRPMTTVKKGTSGGCP